MDSVNDVPKKDRQNKMSALPDGLEIENYHAKAFIDMSL